MDQLLAALRAAGEHSRLRLLAVLRSHELTVTELARILGQSQPRVSRHLKLLCEAGLLERFQEGTWVFYRRSDTALTAAITALIPQDDAELRRDGERLMAITHERAQRAARYFTDMAERWDDYRSLYVEDSAVESAMLDLCTEFLTCRPIKDFLDLGTGTGRLLELFGPHVERALGVDLSREMLAMARTNLARTELAHCRVRQGDVYNLDLANDSADLVTIHHVLHFLDRPMDAIAEAARVLRPGGRIVAVDFGPHELESFRNEHAHRRLGFNDAEIESWLTQAGFGQVRASHLAPVTEDRRPSLVTCIWTADLPLRPPIPLTASTAA